MTSERVSAYLDGELYGDELAEFTDEMSRDAELAVEVAEIGAVRERLRNLGEVDPPFGYFERLVSTRSRRARRGRVLAVVGAVAAAAIVFAGLTPLADPLRVVPALDDFVAEHAAADPGDMPAMSDAELEAMPPMDTDGAMEMMHAVHFDDGVDWVQYQGADGSMVSVFRQEGSLDDEDLPEDLAPMDDDMWMGAGDGHEVAVVDAGDTVVTIVADEHDDLMHAMHLDMSGGDRSLATRARSAAQAVIELFSFG